MADPLPSVPIICIELLHTHIEGPNPFHKEVVDFSGTLYFTDLKLLDGALVVECF